MRFKNYLPWIVLLGVLLIFLGIFLTAANQNLLTSTKEEIPLEPVELKIENGGQENNYFLVKRVIDGDTIGLTDGARVRYIGIDTPEAGDCFGKEATLVNSSLLDSKEIVLEEDIEKLDRYGRKLAYVWVDGLLVNEELVKKGVATVTTYPPNVKYVDRFLEAQQDAKEQKLGIWAQNVCGAENGDVKGLNTPTNNGCLIRGNISSGGEKIYHMPGQRYYEKTQIDEIKGERWFCNEEDAVGAGWRKSKL